MPRTSCSSSLPLLLKSINSNRRYVGTSISQRRAHDKEPRVGIGGHAVHLGRASLVHSQRNGVVTLGVVNHHMPDPVDNASEQLALSMSGQLVEFHVTSLAAKSAISASV